MIKKYLINLIEEMEKTGRCKEDEKEIVLYGLISTVESVLLLLTVLTTGVILHLLFECVLFIVSFKVIRNYSGGIHCNSTLSCYKATCGIFTLTLTTIKYTPEIFLIQSSVLLLIVSIPIIFIFSPLGTPTKPLDEAERKHFRNKALLHLVAESVVICLLIAIGQKVFAFTMCLAVFLSSMVLVAELVRRKFARGGSHSGET